MVTVIGVNTMITCKKDMEHLSGQLERDTSGSGCRVSDAVMEFTDSQMEESIMDSGNRIRGMVTDFIRVSMEWLIIPSGRISYEREMQL